MSTGPAEAAALSLSGVTKAFGSNTVLRGVDLRVPQGSTVALVGPSASGKSVLLKCAAGLLSMDSGEVSALGVTSVRDWRPLRPKIGVLFQQNALFDSMRVWQNVAFPLRRFGMAKAAARAKAFEWLATVGLDERAGNGFPKDLSGGMRKRAAMARAVAGDPDLMLLDDPTAGLDPVLAASMEQLIRHLVRVQNAAALVVTADVHDLAERFDYVAVLDDGQIRWQGPSADAVAGLHPLLASAA